MSTSSRWNWLGELTDQHKAAFFSQVSERKFLHKRGWQLLKNRMAQLNQRVTVMVPMAISRRGFGLPESVCWPKTHLVPSCVIGNAIVRPSSTSRDCNPRKFHEGVLSVRSATISAKVHTLTKAAKGVHTTFAMAAGVTDRVWTVSDVVALLD